MRRNRRFALASVAQGLSALAPIEKQLRPHSSKRPDAFRTMLSCSNSSHSCRAVHNSLAQIVLVDLDDLLADTLFASKGLGSTIAIALGARTTALPGQLATFPERELNLVRTPRIGSAKGRVRLRLGALPLKWP